MISCGHGIYAVRITPLGNSAAVATLRACRGGLLIRQPNERSAPGTVANIYWEVEKMNKLILFVAFPFSWIGERLARWMTKDFAPGPYVPSNSEEDFSLFSQELRDYARGYRSGTAHIYPHIDPVHHYDDDRAG